MALPICNPKKITIDSLVQSLYCKICKILKQPTWNQLITKNDWRKKELTSANCFLIKYITQFSNVFMYACGVKSFLVFIYLQYLINYNAKWLSICKEIALTSINFQLPLSTRELVASLNISSQAVLRENVRFSVELVSIWIYTRSGHIYHAQPLLGHFFV